MPPFFCSAHFFFPFPCVAGKCKIGGEFICCDASAPFCFPDSGGCVSGNDCAVFCTDLANGLACKGTPPQGNGVNQNTANCAVRLLLLATRVRLLLLATRTQCFRKEFMLGSSAATQPHRYLLLPVHCLPNLAPQGCNGKTGGVDNFCEDGFECCKGKCQESC